jgi:tRNA threonylcarbamoyladenosine biosynthesis protein TsaE
MNTEKTFSHASEGPEQTALLAGKLAANIRGGEVIVFVSDVGGGKTTFVKALVAALGSTDHVASPTFTVSKVYTAPKVRIVHYDFYRLHDPLYVQEALEEELQEKDTVCCIEWPAGIQTSLPKERLTIHITKDQYFENKRTISFSAYASCEYLLKGLEI